MKKFSVIAKSVVIAMSMIGITYADNTWTGFYVGPNAGFAFNNAQLNAQHLAFSSATQSYSTSANFLSFFPGIQLGYMYQFANTLVVGGEANATFNTNQEEVLKCTCIFNPDVSDRFIFKNQMQMAIKGRVGRVYNWRENIFLPYFTGGASFANVGLRYNNEGGDYYSTSTMQAGWLVGAGIEWAFKQHWSVRAEYNYIGYGNNLYLNIPSVYGLIDPNGHARVDLSVSNVVVAINYWI